MKELYSSDDNFIAEVCDLFKTKYPVFIFEFSGVYGLIAANSFQGVKALDVAKNRLPHKFYSSVLGSQEILSFAKPNKLVELKESLIETFEGSFIRFVVDKKESNNALISNGTHQILIKRLFYRNVFKLLENGLSKFMEPSPYFSFNCFAPICSSANISGDIAGSITSKQRALEFAKARNIKLFIHSKLNTLEQGSYPVFSIDENLNVKIERKGLNDGLILSKANRLFNNISI
jgi:tRNA A37 threonylcarbamoyladenosine synthetase subunit TsaC/SUA5/YrdC